MDKRTCNHASGFASDEKDNELCKKLLYRLFQTKERLDQPLNNLMEEDVYKIAEQLRTLIKAMRCLPIETLNQYVSSSDRIFQLLQDGVIHLYLALDHLSSSNDKAVFYKHIFTSQQIISEIFTSSLSGTSEIFALHVSEVSEITASIDSSGSSVSFTEVYRKPAFNYKAMYDFSYNALPVLCALFESVDAICPEQCEQAILDMKKLEALLEKQKNTLRAGGATFDESDEYARLRCKLGVELDHTDELTLKLISLFSTFQSRCFSQSKYAARSRKEIIYFLMRLKNHYDKMLKTIREVNALQDTMRFLRKHQELSSEYIVSRQDHSIEMLL